MKILKIGVGNHNEAFIKKNFCDGVNIISSDDNNKGKTIVIQSMMYALGNEPSFPATFEYRNYIYYIEFEIEETKYCLCRHGNSFVIRSKSDLSVFDNVSEFKRYWNKQIFTLPTISKDVINKIVDPVLFVQLFFVGQDNKDTSNVANKGFYNKNDFIEMIYSICGFSKSKISQEECDILKEKKGTLKEEQKILLKQNKILKSKKLPVAYLSSTSDRLAFQEKMSQIQKFKERIGTLRKERNSSTVKKINWETTLKELQSINRNIKSGKLQCMDCGSTNISFLGNGKKENSFSFDISTVELRSQILSIVNDKIASYEEEIERITVEINKEQDNLNLLLLDEDVTLESIVTYKEEIFNASDADKRLNEITSEIESIDAQIIKNDDVVNDLKEKRDLLFKTLIDTMNSFYKKIDISGNTTYTNLFTPKSELYSGSEAIVFYIVKLLAYQSVLKHDYPIIIDSFRAEDLSTQKEEIIIKLCQNIDNQVILTTTLKSEEKGKYDGKVNINHIDYLGHVPNKILQSEYVDELRNLLSYLSVNI